jgi:PAS domain S-box-containing protein
VLQAGTGAEAIELAMQTPALITLDIKLPDIDGYEVCRRLRAIPETYRIPILHISANYVAPQDKVKALEGGADGYLAEPITKDELLATVRSLLRMKAAEEDARRSERELRFLADSIPHLVWITDLAGSPLYFNDRWFQFTGLSESDLLANGWIQLIHRDDARELSELWQLSLRSGTPFQAKARYRNAEGDYRWMSMRAVLMQPDGSQAGEWIGTSTDITEEKHREEVMRRTERLALAGRLAASIAHEINNPLEAITNIFYILESSSNLPDEVMDLVRTGGSELKRVSHIVRQTLSYYRHSNKPVEVDISELLEDTLRILDHHLVARQVTATTQYKTKAKIFVFASEIRQVFSNLILNAVEAMPDGGRLIVKVQDGRDWQGNGRGILVTIADTGTGIPAADRSRIFDAFFTTKCEKGTGLGLWVSNDIVRKHGGRIRIKTSISPGRSGTVFSVFIPAIRQ